MNRDSVENRPHTQTVEKVIRYMYQHYDQELTLEDLAKVSSYSPFHFNRIFQSVTGIPPMRFLSYIRLQKAKEHLSHTNNSIDYISSRIGYESPTTFTTKFKESTGSVTPLKFRKESLSYVDLLYSADDGLGEEKRSFNSLHGSIKVPERFSGIIFVGVFKEPIPKGVPTYCKIMKKSGEFRIDGIENGIYYIFSVAFSWFDNPLEYFLMKHSIRGSSNGPVFIQQDRVIGETNIVLRPPKITDPPILVSLPQLVAKMIKNKIR